MCHRFIVDIKWFCGIFDGWLGMIEGNGEKYFGWKNWKIVDGNFIKSWRMEIDILMEKKFSPVHFKVYPKNLEVFLGIINQSSTSKYPTKKIHVKHASIILKNQYRIRRAEEKKNLNHLSLNDHFVARLKTYVFLDLHHH